MTDEQLAAAIQNGQTELLYQLWKQNERFIGCKAAAWKRAFPNRPDFDAEDLTQQAWFALCDAVKHFHSDKENGNFHALLNLCLKRQFQIVTGVYTSKRDAAFYASVSLDQPINADEPGGQTVGDTISDPDSGKPFEQVNTDSEREYMRAMLDQVARERLTIQQTAVYNSLLSELRCPGMTPAQTQYHKAKVLEALRGDPRILRLWLDVTERRETVEDIAYSYMHSVGSGTFNERGASAVEQAFDAIVRAEQGHQVKTRHLEKALEGKLHEAGALLRRERAKQQKRQMLSDLTTFENQRFGS